MLFRLRSLAKYIILLTIIWIIKGILFKSKSIYKETEINEELINKIFEKAKEKQKEIENISKPEVTENKHFLKNSNQRDDHDHPEEEKQKVQEQNKDLDRKVQLNAPKILDMNAPGTIKASVKLISNKSINKTKFYQFQIKVDFQSFC